jgi:hypothetical protein
LTGAAEEGDEIVGPKHPGMPLRFAQMVRERRLVEAFGLPEGQAAVIERGLSEDTLLELEIAELPDRVEVFLDVSLGNGRDYRPLARLSPGQKSTAILLLIMLTFRRPRFHSDARRARIRTYEGLAGCRIPNLTPTMCS